MTGISSKGPATDKYDTYSKSKSSSLNHRNTHDPREKERNPVRGNSKLAVGSSVSGESQKSQISSVYIQGRQRKNMKLQKLDNGSAVYYPGPTHSGEGISAMYVLGPVPIPMLNNSSDLVLIKVQVRSKK